MISTSTRARQLFEYVSAIPIRTRGQKADNFTHLIRLLKSIQSRGEIATLSQIEDLLPLQVYNSKNASSFRGIICLIEYIAEAEAIDLIHVERFEAEDINNDGIVILLKPSTEAALEHANTRLANALAKQKVSYSQNSLYDIYNENQPRMSFTAQSSGPTIVGTIAQLESIATQAASSLISYLEAPVFGRISQKQDE